MQASGSRLSSSRRRSRVGRTRPRPGASRHSWRADRGFTLIPCAAPAFCLYDVAVDICPLFVRDSCSDRRVGSYCSRRIRYPACAFSTYGFRWWVYRSGRPDGYFCGCCCGHCAESRGGVRCLPRLRSHEVGDCASWARVAIAVSVAFGPVTRARVHPASYGVRNRLSWRLSHRPATWSLLPGSGRCRSASRVGSRRVPASCSSPTSSRAPPFGCLNRAADAPAAGLCTTRCCRCASASLFYVAGTIWCCNPVLRT